MIWISNIARPRRFSRVRCTIILFASSLALATLYHFTQNSGGNDGDSRAYVGVDTQREVQDVDRENSDFAREVLSARVTHDIIGLTTEPMTTEDILSQGDDDIVIVRETAESGLMRMLNEGVHILMLSRFRAGATITEQFFTRDNKFFGVHEPGAMIQHSLGLPKTEESPDELEKIRPDLLNFMDDIYHCNLERQQFYYFIDGLSAETNSPQRHPVMRRGNNDEAVRVCQSKTNKIITVCRLYNVFEAENLIKDNHVKVIVLIRDPRGLISSRMTYLNISASQTFESSGTKVKLHPKMTNTAIEYCKWLRINFIVPSSLPDWLNGRYLAVRYEDLQAEPAKVVRYMYDFADVPMSEDVMWFSNEFQSEDAQIWRRRLTLQQITAIQEMCGRDLFRSLGYKLAYNTPELFDDDLNFVTELKGYSPNARRRWNKLQK